MADTTNNDVQVAQQIPNFFNEFEGTVEEFKELLGELGDPNATEEDKKLLDEINRGQVFIYAKETNENGEEVKKGIAIYTRGAFFNTEGGDANDFTSSDDSIQIEQKGKQIDLKVNPNPTHSGGVTWGNPDDGEDNQNITVTNPIGNFKAGTPITEGMNLLQILTQMLQKTEQPTAVNPSVTIGGVKTETYEVGDTKTGVLSKHFTDGYFKGSGIGVNWNPDKRQMEAGCTIKNITYSGTGCDEKEVNSETCNYSHEFISEEEVTYNVSVKYTASQNKPQNSDGVIVENLCINAGDVNDSKTITSKFKCFLGYVKVTFGADIIETKDTPYTESELIGPNGILHNSKTFWCDDDIEIYDKIDKNGVKYTEGTNEYPATVILVPEQYSDIKSTENFMGSNAIDSWMTQNTGKDPGDKWAHITYKNSNIETKYSIIIMYVSDPTFYKNIKIGKKIN